MNSVSAANRIHTWEWWFLRVMRDSRLVALTMVILFAGLGASLWMLAVSTRVAEDFPLVGRFVLDAFPVEPEGTSSDSRDSLVAVLSFVRDDAARAALERVDRAEIRVTSGGLTQSLPLSLRGPVEMTGDGTGFLGYRVAVDGIGTAPAVVAHGQVGLMSFVLRVRRKTLWQVLRGGEAR